MHICEENKDDGNLKETGVTVAIRPLCVDSCKELEGGGDPLGCIVGAGDHCTKRLFEASSVIPELAGNVTLQGKHTGRLRILRRHRHEVFALQPLTMGRTCEKPRQGAVAGSQSGETQVWGPEAAVKRGAPRLGTGDTAQL